MLTVACVLRVEIIQDPRWKTAYLLSHVERLRDQVAKHLKQPHRFVCLSNASIEKAVERIPLLCDLPGWWSKIELFRPNLFEGRVLYLDLDVTVVGALDPIANVHLGGIGAPLAAIKDYERPTLNSSVMVFQQRACRRIFSEFSPDLIPALPGGDQEWITRQFPDAWRFPPDWCPSFKHHCRFSVPKGARVIVYHGKPKSWDLPADHLVFA